MTLIKGSVTINLTDLDNNNVNVKENKRSASSVFGPDEPFYAHR